MFAGGLFCTYNEFITSVSYDSISCVHLRMLWVICLLSLYCLFFFFYCGCLYRE